MPSYSKEEQLKSVKKKKSKTYINPISDKKKKRLKEGKSEKALFLDIWNERSVNGINYCEKCGKALTTPKTHHFDHITPKSKGEKYRLDKNNIQILCFAHHFEKTHGLKYKGPDLDL